MRGETWSSEKGGSFPNRVPEGYNGGSSDYPRTSCKHIGEFREGFR